MGSIPNTMDHHLARPPEGLLLYPRGMQEDQLADHGTRAPVDGISARPDGRTECHARHGPLEESSHSCTFERRTLLRTLLAGPQIQNCKTSHTDPIHRPTRFAMARHVTPPADTQAAKSKGRTIQQQRSVR